MRIRPRCEKKQMKDAASPSSLLRSGGDLKVSAFIFYRIYFLHPIDISLKTTNFRKSQITIHPNFVVEIFWSRPKLWTEQLATMTLSSL